MANGSGMLIRQYAYDQARRNSGKEVKILSERELCKIYNVSRPTVRKSLDELVSEGMLIIRKGQGTFTNPRMFKDHYLPGGKLSVGIIVGSGKIVVYDKFFWEIISESGKTICEDFSDIRLIQAINDNEKAVEEILLLNLDGLIWVHPTNDRAQAIEMIQQRGVPVMCVNRIPEGENINYVSTDFYAAGKAVAEYLLNKGHRKILFIANTAIDAYNLFYNGYRDTFTARNIDLDDHLLISNEDEIITDINNLCRFKIEFTACFALGSCIWQAIEAFKRNYGEDFGEKYMLMTTYAGGGKLLNCPFVNINPGELGKTAALELNALIEGKRQSPVRVKLVPGIIEQVFV